MRRWRLLLLLSPPLSPPPFVPAALTYTHRASLPSPPLPSPDAFAHEEDFQFHALQKLRCPGQAKGKTCAAFDWDALDAAFESA